MCLAYDVSQREASMEGIFLSGQVPDYCEAELPCHRKDHKHQSVNDEDAPYCDPAQTDCVNRGPTQRATRNAIGDKHTTGGAMDCRHDFTSGCYWASNLLHFLLFATAAPLAGRSSELIA